MKINRHQIDKEVLDFVLPKVGEMKNGYSYYEYRKDDLEIRLESHKAKR